MTGSEYTGFRWSGLEAYPEQSPWRQRARGFLDHVDWDALCRYVSDLHGGMSCSVEPAIALGGRHMVRIIRFSNQNRWVVRLRMPCLQDNNDDPMETRNASLEQEVGIMRLVASETHIPVPKVYGYIAATSNPIGAPFMLMELLSGNCAMDLNFDSVPLEYRDSFFVSTARIQAEMSKIVFPKIGSIQYRPDGTYSIGPLPRIGGPFDTATDYLQAWARTASFPILPPYSDLETFTTATCGSYADEILQSIREFPHRIFQSAEKLWSFKNTGPFPLFHGDFGHNNIVVDDRYNILGVIDWEDALAAPWQMLTFPLLLQLTPPAMDIPNNYNSDGTPKDPATRMKLEDRKRYLISLDRVGVPASTLRSVLSDSAIQALATAMRLYSIDGKLGWYTRLLEVN